MVVWTARPCHRSESAHVIGLYSPLTCPQGGRPAWRWTPFLEPNGPRRQRRIEALKKNK